MPQQLCPHSALPARLSWSAASRACQHAMLPRLCRHGALPGPQPRWGCGASCPGASRRAAGRVGAGARERQPRRARKPGFFEVKKISPPAESLGIHELPHNTHNGDMISVHGEDYVVRTLVLKYKLVGGRYQRDHSRLDCTATSRFIVDTYYDQLLAR